MELKKIQHKIQCHSEKRQEYLLAKGYYKNDTEIKYRGVKPKSEEADPLRTADNRIAHNFHEILVDEKVAYIFTYPVLIDVDGNTELNEQIEEILGYDFERKTKNLCVDASNCGRAWLHYWIAKDNIFCFNRVNTEEIIPTYSNTLDEELESVIRYYVCYEDVPEQIAEQPYTYIEYWTDATMDRYKIFGSTYTGQVVSEEHINHNLGAVPFIEFANNAKKQSDLSRYKPLIDLYDRVISGFANDLEDIQQIIYILENYGGQDLGEFLGDLKRYKAIKTESDGVGGSGGVKTLQIEIPVDARKVILETLKKQIYESGQGLQQDVESVGNASGKMLCPIY